MLGKLKPIVPIATMKELIDAILHAREVIDSSEEVERIIDGLMRLGGEKCHDFEERLQPLLVEDELGVVHLSNQRRPAVLKLLGVNPIKLDQLIGNWLSLHFPALKFSFINQSKYQINSIFSTHTWMMETLVGRIKKQKFGPVLSIATHEGGWIDPHIFVERYNSLILQRIRIDRHDLILAMLRLAPDHREEALHFLNESYNPFTSVIKYALGMVLKPGFFDRLTAQAEWLAAGRARNPGTELGAMKYNKFISTLPGGKKQGKFRLVRRQSEFKKFLRTYQSDWDIDIEPDPGDFKPHDLYPSINITVSCKTLIHGWMYPWARQLTTTMWPVDDDTKAVHFFHILADRPDPNAMNDAVVVMLRNLFLTDQSWSEMVWKLICVGFNHHLKFVQHKCEDALIEAIHDGRACTNSLVENWNEVNSIISLKLNRFVDSLRNISRESLLAEAFVAETLDKFIDMGIPTS
ncbi:MAG: DUF6493 family protein [Planctomycetaceae bacterium]